MSVRAAEKAGAQFTTNAGTPGITEPETDEGPVLGYPDDGEVEFDVEEAIDELDADAEAEQSGLIHRMHQMGAKRIGSLAIGIAVVGIVLNQMSSLDIVANSTGVVDVSSIFNVAGAGLNLLVIGVIIAAAAVLLSLWSGF